MTTTAFHDADADAEFEPALERTMHLTDDLLMAVAEAHRRFTFDIEDQHDGISPEVQRARHLVSTIASDLSDAIAALSAEAREVFYEYIIAANTVLVEATGACVVLVQLPAR